jgi:hypothetical protein
MLKTLQKILQHINNLRAGEPSLMPKPSMGDDNEFTQRFYKLPKSKLFMRIHTVYS